LLLLLLLIMMMIPLAEATLGPVRCYSHGRPWRDCCCWRGARVAAVAADDFHPCIRLLQFPLPSLGFLSFPTVVIALLVSVQSRTVVVELSPQVALLLLMLSLPYVV